MQKYPEYLQSRFSSGVWGMHSPESLHSSSQLQSSPVSQYSSGISPLFRQFPDKHSSSVPHVPTNSSVVSSTQT